MRATARENFSAILAAPFGALGIATSDGHLHGITFLPPGTAPREAQGGLERQVCIELEAYLNDPDHVFSLPLMANGTIHQKRVWAEIAVIPRGQFRSYGELAARLGSAPRAVGQACGANPLPLVVPCHRVVSRRGIGGFANARDGYLLDTKIWLLRHEGALL